MSIDESLHDEFKFFIKMLVKQYYSPGLFWKARLRAKLTKAWNNPRYNIGNVSLVREQIGEQQATELFQNMVDVILNDEAEMSNALSQDVFS